MEEKKQRPTNTNTDIIIITILLALCMMLAGYFIDREFISAKEYECSSTTISRPVPTAVPVSKNDNKGRITKFNDDYSLTVTIKEAIAKAIEANSAIGTAKVNVESIKLVKVYGYFIKVEASLDSNENIFANIVKVDNNFKCYNFGTGELSYPDGTTDSDREEKVLELIFD